MGRGRAEPRARRAVPARDAGGAHLACGVADRRAVVAHRAVVRAATAPDSRWSPSRGAAHCCDSGTMTDVHPSNADAATAWDGATGDIWTDNADLFDAAVARYLKPFLDAAGIEPTTHVLDVGCGNGLTTREAARLASAGSVTGVDLSTRMLDQARRRAAAEGLANVSFVQADVQIADLGEARYDRVISRNGVMFFGDPVAAFANLARALKPGGRMVLLVWQPMSENPWFTAFREAVAVGRELPTPPPAPRPRQGCAPRWRSTSGPRASHTRRRCGS